MSEEFGGDIITITDEDGNVYELEHLDTIEMDGAYYLAFLPVTDGKADEDLGMVILKSEHGEDGDDYLVNPPDEEVERAYEKFMEELFPEDEEPEE